MRIVPLIFSILVVKVSGRDLSCSDVGTHTCDIKFNEVCGSDGNTYINFCVFEKARCFSDPSLQKVRDGPCCPDIENCQVDETSDDKYPNDCVFWYHKCRHLMFVEGWVNTETLVGSLQTEAGNKSKNEIKSFLADFSVEVNIETLTWSELHDILETVHIPLLQ